MSHPREAELLAALPPDAAAGLRKVLEHPSPKSTQDFEPLRAALKAVQFPEGRIYPLPSALTPAQRALAELLAHHEGFNVYPFAVPGGALRKKWLGLEPGGVLETELVDV